MGGWFKRSEGGKLQEPAAITPLEQRVEALERGHRSMRLEWEDVYDRLMKAAARLNARTRREVAPEPPDQVDPVTETPAPGLGTHALLTEARARRTRT